MHGYKILKDVTQTCSQIGMRPFLMFGTLLGCVRDRGFIAGDSDIDLGLLEQDASNFSALKQELLRRQYTVRQEFTLGGRLSEVTFIAPRLELTVGFSLWYRREATWEFAEYWSNHSEVLTYSYPSFLLEQLQTINFDGVSVFAPTHAESVLEMTYGNWKYPNSGFNPRQDYRNVTITPWQPRDSVFIMQWEPGHNVFKRFVRRIRRLVPPW